MHIATESPVDLSCTLTSSWSRWSPHSINTSV